MIVGNLFMLNSGIINVNKVREGIVCKVLVKLIIIVVVFGKCVSKILSGIVMMILMIKVSFEI